MSADAADRVDVVVAGAGMAGASFALAAAQGGLSVALIDPLPFETQIAPDFDGRASAIAFSCLRQWRVLGAAEAMAPHAQRIEQILVTDGRAPGAAGRAPGAAFLRFDGAELGPLTQGEAQGEGQGDALGEPMGWMVENRVIRAALAQALARTPVRLIAPGRVRGVDRRAADALVTLEDGRVLSAAVVVAADGRDSPIAAAAGIGTIGWDYPQVGVVATVRLERDHQGVAHEYFLPGGPFAILPLTEGRASLVWTEGAAKGQALRAARPEVFQAHLQRRFGPFLGRVEAAGPRFVYPLALRLAESLCVPRLALLGDAAHAIHPIAGQGLNLGLKDAAALAQVLVEARRLGEDIGASLVLDRYAAWRRFDTVALAAATDLFTRLFSNDDPLLRLVRGAGMAAVNAVGPARRFFMREAGGASGDMPRLLRGEAL